jgi:hypothetical protein
VIQFSRHGLAIRFRGRWYESMAPVAIAIALFGVGSVWALDGYPWLGFTGLAIIVLPQVALLSLLIWYGGRIAFQKIWLRTRMSKGKSPEEIADDEARTTPVGMYNVADAYLISARALRTAGIKHGLATKPVEFLYSHAVELYLKAFLRLHGETVEVLEKRYRHNAAKLGQRAKKLGLVLDAEDAELFGAMRTTNSVIRTRYIRTGATALVNLDYLDVAAEHLHDKVGDALQITGLQTRPLPPH